jgi:hypothetical protein
MTLTCPRHLGVVGAEVPQVPLAASHPLVQVVDEARAAVTLPIYGSGSARRASS